MSLNETEQESFCCAVTPRNEGIPRVASDIPALLSALCCVLGPTFSPSDNVLAFLCIKH